MKYLLMLALLISSVGYGQTKYYIRADSVVLQKVGGNTTLIVENSTRTSTNAFLRNYNNGRTDFAYAVDSVWKMNDSIIIVRRGDGNDTLIISGGGSGTVTSVGQAYGIINTPNPIVGVGTVMFDSATVFPQVRANGIPINKLTAATGNNLINNAGFVQEWSWDGMEDLPGLNLSSSSATLDGDGTILLVQFSGANNDPSIISTCANFVNTKNGTGSTNIAATFLSSGGTNNYAIIVPASSGSVGIGTSTPSAIFHNVGTARFDLGSDATGDIFYRDASGFLTRLPIGSTGKKLTVVGGLPAWVDSTASASGANTALSNLASVAINTSLLPGTDNAIDLGSTTKGWRKNYLSSAGVIDFGNGLQTITHSGASKLTIQTSGADDTLQILTTGSNRAVLSVAAPSYAAEVIVSAAGTSGTIGAFSGTTGLSFVGTGYISNSTNQINIVPTASVFNQNSNDVDFQVKSDGDDYAVFVDASANTAGAFTAAPNSKFHVNGSFAGGYVAKTGTYTATINDFTIEATANTFTITLPTSVGIPGRIYNIVNSGAGVITIATTSSQTFVNVVATPTTLTLSAVGTYQVQSNGANWIVLSIN